MPDQKYIQKLLELSKQHEIGHVIDENFHLNYTSFEGSPKKHPTDENILILLNSNLSVEKTFFEFSLNTIGNIEDLGTVTDSNGKSNYVVKIWVKKGTTAIKAQPFIIT